MKIFQARDHLYSYAALWHEKRQNAPAADPDIKKITNIHTITAQLISFDLNRSKLKQIGRKILLEYQKNSHNDSLNFDINVFCKDDSKKLLNIFNENWPENYGHFYVSPFCTFCKKLSNYEARKRQSEPKFNHGNRN